MLYLGEINDSQKAAWWRTIEVLQTDSSAKHMALFPADRPAPELECEVVQVKLNELRLHHPRQWGACWLALTLWEQLELDRFWHDRLPASRQGTKWLEVLNGCAPATLWQYYIRLTEIEQAFKELKHDLAIRPIYHQTDKHIEAHIFIAFIAYCLHVTLKQHARSCAPGLTPRAVLEKFATMQMVDVHLPTTDGRQLVLPRYTQPDPDHQLLLQQLKLSLPAPTPASNLRLNPPYPPLRHAAL